MKWTNAVYGRLPEQAARPASPHFSIDSSRRLAWSAGSYRLREPHLAYWGTYAVLVEHQCLVVVEAASPAPLRLAIEELVFAPRRVWIEGAVLHVHNGFGTLQIQLADLERLEVGETEIAIEPVYPARRETRQAARVASIKDGLATIQLGKGRLVLAAAEYGLEVGMDVALVDELAPFTFAAIDVPNRPRQVVFETLPPYTVPATITVLKAETIAIALKPLAKRAELDHLIREIAAHPEDDQNRDVLIDLLSDLGEPCAALFAQARAGHSVTVRKREVAFGPLVHYFKTIELDRGLPHTATLSRTAPDDLTALLGDVRLGLISRLRVGAGSLAIYKALLAARELVALRRIDAPNASVVTAALKGGHRLTHLDELDLSDPLMAGVLVQRELDTVRHFELRTDRREVEVLMRRFIHDYDGILVRAPRHLTFVEPQQFSISLAHSVIAAFPQLAPQTIVTIGGITLRRDGGEIIANVADDGNPQLGAVLHDVLPEARIV